MVFLLKSTVPELLPRQRLPQQTGLLRHSPRVARGRGGARGLQRDDLRLRGSVGVALLLLSPAYIDLVAHAEHVDDDPCARDLRPAEEYGQGAAHDDVGVHL